MADILVVDDDTDVAELLTIVLQSAGHVVRRAADGLEGLRLIEERLPDVIVLDVEMPRLSGPQMAYRLLVADAGRERVPIVLVSGVVDLETVGARVGTPYLLAKPYSAEQLNETLGLALTERRQPLPSS